MIFLSKSISLSSFIWTVLKIKVLNKNKQTVILPKGHKIDISGLGNNRNMIMYADLCTPVYWTCNKDVSKDVEIFSKTLH